MLARAHPNRQVKNTSNGVPATDRQKSRNVSINSPSEPRRRPLPGERYHPWMRAFACCNAKRARNLAQPRVRHAPDLIEAIPSRQRLHRAQSFALKVTATVRGGEKYCTAFKALAWK